MHKHDNDAAADQASAKRPIMVGIDIAPNVAVIKPLERYVWLAPHVMNRRSAVISKDGNMTAQCPAHNDRQRSLSLHPQWGIRCSAGCTYEAMLAALQIRGGPRAVATRP